MRQRLVMISALGLSVLLSGCVSERHFARDTIWPFGDPNAPRDGSAPPGGSETMRRALGHTTAEPPIGPQAGNVWPGPVQPVPTIADEQKAMTQPLGDAYTPSLPSPYPPGTEPPPDADLGIGPLDTPSGATISPATPGVSLSPGLGTQSGTVSNPSAGSLGGSVGGSLGGSAGGSVGGSVGGSSGGSAQ